MGNITVEFHLDKTEGMQVTSVSELLIEWIEVLLRKLPDQNKSALDCASVFVYLLKPMFILRVMQSLHFKSKAFQNSC